MEPSDRKTRQLIILADGGALQDLNTRLEAENEPRKDYTRIPEDIRLALKAANVPTAPGRVDDRVFCNVGSEKAQSFLAKLEQQWTVRSFPLSVAKYDRASEDNADKRRFKLRFHAYLGYALGLITARNAGEALKPIVAIVSDDPHLLPCMAHAQSLGLHVFLSWWQSSLGEEVSYLASKNGIPLALISNAESSSSHSGDRTLDYFLGR